MKPTNTFLGKKVVVTGHTGFKGAWLCTWLEYLGAKVIGMALDPNTNPSLFDEAGLTSSITDIRVDIRNRKINRIMSLEKPDFVFHLAAQPIVKASFEDPIANWETNVMGTLHVLEALRNLDNECVAVIITGNVMRMWNGYGVIVRLIRLVALIHIVLQRGCRVSRSIPRPFIFQK